MNEIGHNYHHSNTTLLRFADDTMRKILCTNVPNTAILLQYVTKDVGGVLICKNVDDDHDLLL